MLKTNIIINLTYIILIDGSKKNKQKQTKTNQMLHEQCLFLKNTNGVENNSI